jgi:hypothetical protein
MAGHLGGIVQRSPCVKLPLVVQPVGFVRGESLPVQLGSLLFWLLVAVSVVALASSEVL